MKVIRQRKCNIMYFTNQANKSSSKTWNRINLKFSIIMNGDDKIDFPCKLFLGNTQIVNIRKTFAKNPLANAKLPKPLYLKNHNDVRHLVNVLDLQKLVYR